MKFELLRAEEDHFNKSLGDKRRISNQKDDVPEDAPKRLRLFNKLEDNKFEEEENMSSSSSSSSSDEDPGSEGHSEADSESESESEDSEDELQRELEKIKQERAEQKLRQEQKEKAREQEEREKEIAYGNPLLNPNATSGSSSRRKWNDDVVFKNQAKGVDDKKDQGFINDMIRSDFHRKFMNKYIR